MDHGTENPNHVGQNKGHDSDRDLGDDGFFPAPAGAYLRLTGVIKQLELRLQARDNHIQVQKLEIDHRDEELKTKTKDIEGLRNEITNLRRERDEFKRAKEVLEAREANRLLGLHHEVTWPHELAMLLQGHSQARPWLGRDGFGRPGVLQLFCKESNMPVSYTYVHPGITFVDPLHAELLADLINLPAQVPNGNNRQQVGPFPLEKLPSNVIQRIFELWLHKKGQLIHAVARLDPWVIPETPIQAPSHIFHYGRQKCSITNGRKPNEELSLLLVCKRFLLLGVHAFYGLNTFAFSSLGEFGNFIDNIGPARRARLRHVEVNWVGNQWLTMVREGDRKTRKNLKYASLRTLPILCATSDMLRLETLAIHIVETSNKDYIRRGHEVGWVRDTQKKNSQGQPNFRLSRELRKLHGIDMLHSLRGMTWMRFYGLIEGIDLREKVHDWSFVEDMNNVCTLDKVPSRKERDKLQNLPTVFHEIQHTRPYHITDEDLQIMGAWFTKERAGGEAYDDLRARGDHLDISDDGSDSDDNSGGSGDSDGSSSSDDSDNTSDSDNPKQPRALTSATSQLRAKPKPQRYRKLPLRPMHNMDDDSPSSSSSDGGTNSSSDSESETKSDSDSDSGLDPNSNGSSSASDEEENGGDDDDDTNGDGGILLAQADLDMLQDDGQPSAAHFGSRDSPPEDELFVPQDEGPRGGNDVFMSMKEIMDSSEIKSESASSDDLGKGDNNNNDKLNNSNDNLHNSNDNSAQSNVRAMAERDTADYGIIDVTRGENPIDGAGLFERSSKVSHRSSVPVGSKRSSPTSPTFPKRLRTV